MSAKADSWPEGVARHLLREVDSTNAEAQRLAPQLRQPTWIMAEHQTAGRGTRGRPWLMPAGNFSATLVLRPEGDAGQAALLSFVAALAVHEALALVTGRPEALALKWPNDVLMSGGKVSGILLESIGQGAVVSHLAIGIGVNLAGAPDLPGRDPAAPRPVSVAGLTGICVKPGEFLDLLAPAFARYHAQFISYGFAPIRTAWLARAAGLGQPIAARTGAETITGTFDGLDETGALVLISAKGRRVLPAAEVFF